MRRINLGVLTVYADEPDEAEVAILVHPNYRRLGYAKELFHVFRETMKAVSYTHLTLPTH